jgi:glycerophosphoryl diester phosphodiesterase
MSRPIGPSWLFARPFAHRGLWRAEGPPENSMAAFAAARAAGVGAELDIRISADGEAMIFHDETLARMTGASGAVGHMRAAALAAFTLQGGGERIPRLVDVLAAFPDTPLLIEMKTSPGEEGPLEARAAALLADRAGPTGVMSFNPVALARFASLAPHIPRGQLTTGFGFGPDGAPALLPVDHGAGTDVSNADFLCCNVEALAAYGAPAAARLALPLIAWTVRTPAQLARARALARNWIFEALPLETPPVESAAPPR